MKLDLVQTVAFAGLLLFLGYGLKRLIPALARYNIPAPVVGGLPMAGIFAIGYAIDWRPLVFDTTLQTPLQNTFFASVGFGASVLLLKRGGPLVLIMMVVGVDRRAASERGRRRLSRIALGEHPLMGVLAGSVTLTGGPATGLAFAPRLRGGRRAGRADSRNLGGDGSVSSPADCSAGRSPPTSSLDIPTRYRRLPRSERWRTSPSRQFVEPPSSAPVSEDVEAYALLEAPGRHARRRRRRHLGQRRRLPRPDGRSRHTSAR